MWVGAWGDKGLRQGFETAFWMESWATKKGGFFDGLRGTFARQSVVARARGGGVTVGSRLHPPAPHTPPPKTPHLLRHQLELRLQHLGHGPVSLEASDLG